MSSKKSRWNRVHRRSALQEQHCTARAIHAMQALRQVPVLGATRRPAQALLVRGGPRTGKSTLARAYAKEQNSDQRHSAAIPVLVINTPILPSPKGIATALLNALGDPTQRSLSLDSALSRIELWLRKCSVELLVIDECQRLFEERDAWSQRDISSTLQWLLRDMCLPTIFVGTTRHQQLVGQMGWLRSRLNAVVVMRTDPASNGGRP